MLRVGIAMLQGARHEHAEALRGAAAELGLTLKPWNAVEQTTLLPTLTQ